MSQKAFSYRVETAMGTFVYGWRPMTAAEKARVRPLSASGCSQNVCIAIWGTHYYVDEWSTTALWGGGYTCTQSEWWHPMNTRIRSGVGVCGGAGVFFSDWYPRRQFSSGYACNTWDYIPGKPCEYISY